MLRLRAGLGRCGHMSEETKNADVSAAYGVVIAVATSFVVGLLLILGMTFSIQVWTPHRPVLHAANAHHCDGHCCRQYCLPEADWGMCVLFSYGVRITCMWGIAGPNNPDNWRCQWLRGRTDLL